jgi:hypothetical protein
MAITLIKNLVADVSKRQTLICKLIVKIVAQIESIDINISIVFMSWVWEHPREMHEWWWAHPKWNPLVG